MSAPTSRTFAEERRTAIMDMLERSASVQVADIAQAFGVSTVTARGDLDALAAAGKLRRTHGGAVSLHKTLTVSVQDQRVNVNVDAKQSIARAALELVRDGDTVFVDSGTTALEFVRMLDMRTGITVITADITIADYIDESLPSVDVIMLGGELRKGHRYLFGPLTMAAIATIHADLAVICPGAFVAGRGFVTDFPQMAEIKQAAMSAASHSVALMDASKLTSRGTYCFAPIHAVDHIVIDKDDEGTLSDALVKLPNDAKRPQLIVTTEQ